MGRRDEIRGNLDKSRDRTTGKFALVNGLCGNVDARLFAQINVDDAPTGDRTSIG
jgi:hypothetical protein